MLQIAFVVNKKSLLGFGSALLSLIKNASRPDSLKLAIFCSDIEVIDKENILKLISSLTDARNVSFHDFDAKEMFGFLRPLHGDWSNYGRFLIPQFYPETEVLYLDADILVEIDLSILQLPNLGETPFGAIQGGEVKFSLESSFYINDCGINPTTLGFNSGVLLINCPIWLKADITKKCIDFGKKYKDKILSCDQAILNALYAGKFVALPNFLNMIWDDTVIPIKNGNHSRIIHFAGSPKPWDPIGRFLHKGFSYWQLYQDSFWQKKYGRISIISIKRVWYLRRSYIRTIMRRFNYFFN